MRDARRRDLRVSAIVAAVLVVVAGVVFATRDGDDAPAEPSGDVSAVVVRDDSRQLDDAGPDAPTLVEFLDFECEACGAAYPVVEELREEFAGQINVVIRYFPLDGHRNSRPAAHAVEAAARQDRLQEMYSAMFTTQQQWGESSEDRSSLFRSYAEEIGLDMAQYDRDVASEEVAQRVQADVQDGLEVGVSGTPTFFLDGQRLEITSEDGFRASLQDAVDG